MDQSERDNLLIRIDQKVIAMEKVLFDSPKYTSIKEKVLIHDKAFWVAITASTIAIIKAFWSSPA